MFKAINSLKKFFKLFSSARIATLASSLAFNTILSIIPLVSLGFWYLQSAGVAQYWIDEARKWLLSHLEIGKSDQFLEIFNSLTTTTGSASWGYVGLGVFLYTGFTLLLSIGNALDDILKVEELQISLKRTAVHTWIRRGLFLILLPLILGLSSGIMLWIRNESWLSVIFEIETYGLWLARPLPWLIDFLAFWLLYFYVPNTKITRKQAASAALFVTPLFILGKMGMSYYSSYALTTQKIYGAFAIAPLLMLWVYWAWLIVLSGALLIHPSPNTQTNQVKPTKKPKRTNPIKKAKK